MQEFFDVYTRDGEYLGIKSKEECHKENPGFYHKPVWVWIINSKKEVLIQKRSKLKKFHPDRWDMPSAGHVVSGESSIEGAIRETKEELGIDTKEEDFEYLGEYISEITWEIGQIYLLKLDIELKDMTLQEEEVAEVKWLPFDEFCKLFFFR